MNNTNANTVVMHLQSSYHLSER